MEIKPRQIKAIGLVQLSPSARHLVVGNHLGHYFYVYELYPAKNQRSQCSCTVQYRLDSVLFRGRTPNSITDCSMKYIGEDLRVIINSSSGTSHIFLVRNYQNQAALGQNSSLKTLQASCKPIQRDLLDSKTSLLTTLQKGATIFCFSSLNELHEFQLSESQVQNNLDESGTDIFLKCTSIP